MVCNTPEQAQRYLDLRAGGVSADDAMKRINDDAHDARACGVAAIAFKRDKMLRAHAVENKLFEVVQINVLAGASAMQARLRKSRAAVRTSRRRQTPGTSNSARRTTARRRASGVPHPELSRFLTSSTQIDTV